MFRAGRFALVHVKINGTLPACFSSAVSEMPPCDFKPLPYKGINQDEAISLRKEYINPSLISNLMFKKPLLLTQGYMQWVWDDKGNRYLDLLAGIATVGVGHCHPKVTEALEDQAKRMWHGSNSYLLPNIHEYAEKLTATLPGNLKVCYFMNSGSEANDMAMLLARLYTGAFNIISLRNAYHGASPYNADLCGHGHWKYNVASGLGVNHAMNPDPYKGPWGGAHCRDSPVQTDRKCSCQTGECEASKKYAEQLEEVLVYSMNQHKIAGFIAESIQGVGGSVQFPKGYLQKVYELIRNKGGICIADEVQTGFCRTGDHFWGFEGHGVIPDIVTMAKGIGNGFPLAALVTTPEIAKCLAAATFFNTFGGNPLACAVGLSVLNVLKEDNLMENCKEVGTYLLLEMAKLRDEFSFVGDVRGKGLMTGIELVADKESRKPLPLNKVNEIVEALKDLGILVGKGGRFGQALRIKPPMCITKQDVDFAVGALRKGFSQVQV